MIDLTNEIENLKKVEKALEKVAYDGHSYETGKRIAKKLKFVHINELGSCIMRAMLKDQYFADGLLYGIEQEIKRRSEELVYKEIQK